MAWKFVQGEKKDLSHRSLAQYVAVVLRKKPELSAWQVFCELERRSIYTDQKEVFPLWKSWHRKPKNGERIIEFRRKGLSA